MRVGLVQMSLGASTDCSPAEIADRMIETASKHTKEAAQSRVQVLCFQELFNQPYFPPSRDPKWYAAAERIPDGPTITRLRLLAQEYQVAMIVPLYEEEAPGMYYNTAAVLDADGSYLGKYRKVHIPEFVDWPEKFFFRPGNLGYPVFKTRFGLLGVAICYDRHFPEVFRALALNRAQLVFVPTATGAHSRSMWELELRAAAVANGLFVAGVNRVGTEAPWNIAQFYGHSLIVDPSGEICAQSGSEEELLVCDLDLEKIRERRNYWKFLHDRRPETYGLITDERHM